MDILLAEDSESTRTMIKLILEKLGFSVTEAKDGKEAWNIILREKAPRIAILDWLMPEISGIELVQKIRAQEKRTKQYTYIIMLTSNGEAAHSEESFNAGVDNYLTKPINHHKLSVTLNIAKRIIQLQTQLETQLEIQQAEIQRAKEIQLFLNTTDLPQVDTVNLRAVYNPSKQMGGDFFNIIKTIHNNIAVIMVDCTGHGLEASMYATLLKSICDRHTHLLDNPLYLSNFVQMVNIDAADYITTDQFPVMFVSVYDTESMKLYYSSANGEHPYVIRNGAVYRMTRVEGMHLGYNTESQYYIKSFIVKNGDIVLYYSDALIEIDGATWNRHNDDDLKEIIKEPVKNLDTLNTKVMSAIEETAGSTVLSDDLSLVYLQVLSPSFNSYILNKSDEIEDMKSEIEDKMKTFDYNDDEIEKVKIAIGELVLNALFHGNRSDESKKVFVDYIITCKSLTVKVEDEGDGFIPEQIPDPTDINRLQKMLDNNDEENYKHGRGVWLVRKLMDSLHYENKGRIATITKLRDPVKSYNNY